MGHKRHKNGQIGTTICPSQLVNMSKKISFTFVIVGGTFLGLGEITQTHARRIRISATRTFCVLSAYFPCILRALKNFLKFQKFQNISKNHDILSLSSLGTQVGETKMSTKRGLNCDLCPSSPRAPPCRVFTSPSPLRAGRGSGDLRPG